MAKIFNRALLPFCLVLLLAVPAAALNVKVYKAAQGIWHVNAETEGGNRCQVVLQFNDHEKTCNSTGNANVKYVIVSQTLWERMPSPVGHCEYRPSVPSRGADWEVTIHNDRIDIFNKSLSVLAKRCTVHK